jgi:glycosyltransferase involved in cell wall biosynthesis
MVTVSVCMITYNHEKYITQALEGVLMQVCDFEIELIVSNDASSDSTEVIIQSIIENHLRGSWIKYIKQEKNIGMMPNFIWSLQQCKGNYIALCEGDDYWTDPLKLQKQVDFLDANIVYSYCGHKSNILSNKILKPITIDVKEITFEKLINQNFVNTATLVFRKAVLGDLPNFFNKVPAGDWLLQLIALKRGKGYVLKDFMSVYRIHQEGVWTSLSSEKMCEQGVKVLEKTKLIYNDRKSIKLIDNAILNRRKKFNVSHVPVHLRIKKRLFKILKKCFKI